MLGKQGTDGESHDDDDVAGEGCDGGGGGCDDLKVFGETLVGLWWYSD